MNVMMGISLLLALELSFAPAWTRSKAVVAAIVLLFVRRRK